MTPRPWALRSLPVFPPIALRAVELLESSDVRLPAIAELVRSDPTIAAGILAVANSPPFLRHHEVEDLDQAIIRVGAVRTASIILGLALTSLFPAFAARTPPRRCWEHSLVSARMSEDLAPRVGVPSGTAYTAALLHTVGQLALSAHYPDEYALMLDIVANSDETFDPLACERSLFEMDHCEAGAWLAKSWGLPERLRNVIANHHAKPAPADDPLLTVVRHGCLIANALGYQVHSREPKPSAAEVLSALGCAEADVATRMVELRAQTRSELEMLAAQSPPSEPSD